MKFDAAVFSWAGSSWLALWTTVAFLIIAADAGIRPLAWVDRGAAVAVLVAVGGFMPFGAAAGVIAGRRTG